MMIERPEVTESEPQNMCMGKGYDYPDIRDLVAESILKHVEKRLQQSRRSLVIGQDGG
jgi:hypothetical protein